MPLWYPLFYQLNANGSCNPQIGFGSNLSGEIGSQIADGKSLSLLTKLNQLHHELGFAAYTDGSKSMIDLLCITAALMVGTAGLPHVIVRFYTVPKVRDARISAGWALLFIAILYTTAPAVAAFARTNLIYAVNEASYRPIKTDSNTQVKSAPDWFKKWENTGLLAWVDKNNDGLIQYRRGPAFEGKPVFQAKNARGTHGERLIQNTISSNDNELYIDRDIMVLANPEIAKLPAWIIALVAQVL